MTSITATRPADATYIVYGEPVWTGSASGGWVDLPGARVPLNLGPGTGNYGGIFVATFTSEAIVNGDPGNVAAATVFFGNTAASPVSSNHRYVTNRGNPEWSSHTFIRTIKFDPSLDARDLTAQVKFMTSNGTQVSVQNWLLKVERFSI